MERIGIYEAKARLADLVERASQGKEVTITRHGRAVAKIVAAKRRRQSGRSQVFDEIEAFARTVKARRFNLRRAIETGRR